jgi:hypothetical protein
MRKRGKAKKKTRAENKYTGQEIFPDTELPNEPNDIILFLHGYKDHHETVTTYRKLAECVLRGNGFDPNDNASLGRLTDNCKLRAEVYESLRVISADEALKVVSELRLKIVREAAKAGGPVAGSENVPRLIEHENAIKLEINELGLKIRARIAGEDNAREGRAVNEGRAEGSRTLSEQADKERGPWLREMRILKTKNPTWNKDDLIEWFENHPAPHLAPLRSPSQIRRYAITVCKEFATRSKGSTSVRNLP